MHCITVSIKQYHHHHHQAHALSWSIAVSTRCFQCSRSWAHFQAELRPRLWGWRSAFRLCHVWWGRPGGRFHSMGRPRIVVLSALEMSSNASILATWPKSWSQLLWISWDSCGGEPAQNRTVALATWSVYGIRRIKHYRFMICLKLTINNWDYFCILQFCFICHKLSHVFTVCSTLSVCVLSTYLHQAEWLCPLCSKAGWAFTKCIDKKNFFWYISQICFPWMELREHF